MRVCPRSHYHVTIIIPKHTGIGLHNTRPAHIYWCQDCGAVRQETEDEWTYPAITSLVRGRGSDATMGTTEIYNKVLRGGDPNDSDGPSPDPSCCHSVASEAGT